MSAKAAVAAAATPIFDSRWLDQNPEFAYSPGPLAVGIGQYLVAR
jgi:hypothetical protein